MEETVPVGPSRSSFLSGYALRTVRDDPLIVPLLLRSYFTLEVTDQSRNVRIVFLEQSSLVSQVLRINVL